MFLLLRWLGGKLDGILWFAQVGGVVLLKVKYQEGVPWRGRVMGSGTLWGALIQRHVPSERG